MTAAGNSTFRSGAEMPLQAEAMHQGPPLALGDKTKPIFEIGTVVMGGKIYHELGTW